MRLLLIATLLMGLPALADTRVEGQLLERGTKKPLGGVNIFLLPAKLKATTADDGRFAFETVPDGDFQFVVNSAGYKKLEKSDFAGGEPLNRRLYLERASYQGLEATVVGKVEKRDDSTRTMKAEQFLTMPGSGGDPVKAVQNLPGIARAGGISSQVVIQGSAPQDTSYLIEDIDVPLVFHFGGLTSVVTPEAVDSVDYLSAGYGPEYGGAMGGVIGLKLRDPATDRTKGFVFADTMKAGGLIEGPISEKSSYLVSARYSYLGFLLKAAASGNSSLDLTVAPSFADIGAVYKYKISDKEDFRLVTVGSRDELKFVLKEPVRTDPSVRGNFSTETSFYRIIPEWTRRLDDNHIWRSRLGLGQDLVRIDIGDDYLNLTLANVSLRSEYETKLSESWRSFFGLDTSYAHAEANLRLPSFTSGGGVSNPISSGESIAITQSRDEIVVGPYWRNSLHAADSRWTYMPSLRVDYFTPTHELKPQPRLAARYQVDDSLFYKAATGLYYQLPEVPQLAADFGNPELKSPHAIHYTVGAEKDFRGGSSDGWTTTSNLFYRDFQDLVVPSSKLVERAGVLQVERYSNEGRGRSYGAEFLIRYDHKPWSAWLAYTLSRSFRTEPSQSEHLFRYDQTHNVNVNATIDFENNWKLSGRVRYVTGNPATPVIGGSFDADNDVYVPMRGGFYSERLEPFFQLDGRLDKKWIKDTWVISAYLDVQNLTNRANPEGIRYSYDYSQKATISGLPLLPTIGCRGEF